MSHEIRNVCGAVLVTYGNLSRIRGLAENEDFRALGSLVEGLKRLSAMELRSQEERGMLIELSSVLNELRIIIEPTYREAGMKIFWSIDGLVPRIEADHYGLLQVFLNLAQNSHRAMAHTQLKELKVSASVEQGFVVVRFEDSGTGVAHPENLFRPFQSGAVSSGIGLYVSRAILKSFGAEIIHEARETGCCFAVMLQAVSLPEVQNA
jgi:C4-dicarboxylate-specific signal transduction histidine kinase